eukprot:12320661-Alexandrium_andersonii.AAC.1
MPSCIAILVEGSARLAAHLGDRLGPFGEAMAPKGVLIKRPAAAVVAVPEQEQEQEQEKGKVPPAAAAKALQAKLEAFVEK